MEIDLDAFATGRVDPEPLRETTLQARCVRVWPASGNTWVAELEIGGRPAFVIGSPTIFDRRVFATLAAALGALCWHLGVIRKGGTLTVRADLAFCMPKQDEIGKGWSAFEVAGAEPTYLAVGRHGSTATVHDSFISARNEAYDSAVSASENDLD